MTSGQRCVGQQIPSQPARTAELFRSDLISAMKLPDSHQLEPSSFVEIKEAWRSEWEIGVQVCIRPDNLLQPSFRTIEAVQTTSSSHRKGKDLKSDNARDDKSDTDSVSFDNQCYEVDELDLCWLESVNQKRKSKVIADSAILSIETLQQAITLLEHKCQESMMRAVATDKGLGVEYDEYVVCDVCRDTEREDSNEMVFCDSCNVCVHQACYGVTELPQGSWLCRPCSAQLTDVSCLLCSNRGGALKKVRPGPGWAHMNCALWIQEARVGNVEKMEPITCIENIPVSRWNLLCCICKKKEGACIQCLYPKCRIPFHVTCAFNSGLEMRSQIDHLHNGVLQESYCPKHTSLRKTPTRLCNMKKDCKTDSSKLYKVQESFHRFAKPQVLVTELHISHQLSQLIFNYWKLKRRSQHNTPLLPNLPLEELLQQVSRTVSTTSTQPKPSDSPKVPGDDEKLLLLVNMRENLEKARNLIYMVKRREQLKKQFVGSLMKEFQLEATRLEQLNPPRLLNTRIGTRSITQQATSHNLKSPRLVDEERTVIKSGAENGHCLSPTRKHHQTTCENAYKAFTAGRKRLRSLDKKPFTTKKCRTNSASFCNS